MHNKTFNVINSRNLIVIVKNGKMLHCAKQGRIRYWLTATDAWNSQYQKHQSVVVLKASKEVSRGVDSFSNPGDWQ